MSFDENLINNPSKGMPRLLEIMRALRDPDGGCPWDIEQNFKTIAPYTVEEAYEVADAIERENWEDLKNELGDLLLQTVYHTQMAEEEDLFKCLFLRCKLPFSRVSKGCLDGFRDKRADKIRSLLEPISK